MSATAATITGPGSLETLATRALIGTDRAGGGAATAAALLKESAIRGLRARAGYRAAAGATPVEECPRDAAAVVGSAPAGTLARLLADPDAAIIEEWAELATARGLRVPEAMVPVLLDWWARQPRRSEAVFRVTGKRGEWLASLNPSWRKAVAGEEIPADAEARWETGTPAERVALLKTVRRCEPARALAMVRGTWKADGADERSRFVDQFDTGLSMADEPFLEECLDDRSKQVRASAARLLMRLPESRFAQRMLERTLAIFGVKKGAGLLGKETKVSVEPPTEFDPEWVRDGLEEKPPEEVGKRAWWLQQILGATNPSSLAGALRLSPRELLSAVRGHDYADDVFRGIVAAATATTDAAWCEVILSDALASKFGPRVMPDRAALWERLPPATRERLLLEGIGDNNLARTTRWGLLAYADHPWSADFSRRAMESLGGKAPVAKADAYTASAPIGIVSRHIHTTALDLFEAAMVPLFGDDIPPSIRKIIDRVRLRAEMHKEFES